MADNRNNKSKIRGVDDAGIRLAPAPTHNSGYHVMPSITQEFVIQPKLVGVDKGSSEAENTAPKISTANDFQPKKEEANKKWKRGKRAKNMIVGTIMFIVSVVVLLPYILGAIGQSVKFPIVISFERFNVVGNIVSAFKDAAALGWKGDGVLTIWLWTIPDLILTIGILSVVINAIKSIIALFGAVKPIKYIGGAIANMLCVCAIFVASLVGAGAIGIAKIDFMQDFIHGYGTNETFTMVVFGAGYLLVSVLVSLINRDKCGYLK